MANSLGDIGNNETLVVQATIYDADTGDVRDLSNYDTITFVLHDHDDHSNKITVTDADGVDASQAADGILTVTVSDDLMRNLCAKDYAWELHIKFDDGSEANAGQGTISVYEGLV